MKSPRSLLHLRSAKFAPLAIASLFFLTNATGMFATPALAAPALAAIAKASTQVDTLPADIPITGDCDVDCMINRAAVREGLDPRFVHAVVLQESKYDTHALSQAGARGLMQLMPATAERFGCDDANDAAANVKAGTKYLAWLLKRFSGDVTLALAGYNAGEGAVDRYKGVPPYSETQNYVKKIVSNYGKAYHPVLPRQDIQVTDETPVISNGL